MKSLAVVLGILGMLSAMALGIAQVEQTSWLRVKGMSSTTTFLLHPTKPHSVIIVSWITRSEVVGVTDSLGMFWRWPLAGRTHTSDLFETIAYTVIPTFVSPDAVTLVAKSPTNWQIQMLEVSGIHDDLGLLPETDDLTPRELGMLMLWLSSEPTLPIPEALR